MRYDNGPGNCVSPKMFYTRGSYLRGLRRPPGSLCSPIPHGLSGHEQLRKRGQQNMFQKLPNSESRREILGLGFFSCRLEKVEGNVKSILNVDMGSPRQFKILANFLAGIKQGREGKEDGQLGVHANFQAAGQDRDLLLACYCLDAARPNPLLQTNLTDVEVERRKKALNARFQLTLHFAWQNNS